MEVGLVVNIMAAYLSLSLSSVIPTPVIIKQNWRSGGTPDCRFSADTGQNGSVVVNSLVQCLALLQPHNGDLRTVSFDPGTGNCESVLGSSSKMYVTESRAFPSNQEDCAAQWTKIFEADRSGSVLFGSVDAVKMAVQNGSEIRIEMKPNFFMELTGINIESDQVCGLAIFVLSKASWDSFKDDMFWNIIRICTTGRMLQNRIFLGTPDRLDELRLPIDFKNATWFSRKMEPRTSAGNPVFSTTNTSCCGSKADVISDAEAGAYVTVNIHHKNSYSYFVYGSRIQFVYGQGTCEAAVHLPWFVGRKAGMLFHNPPFWFMLLVSTEKIYEVSRWYIGLHKYKDIQSLYSGSTDWYIDSCWKIFYSQGENGETIVGSTANLQNAILNGRRIRIVFDSYAMEADNIVIDNGLVIAQLLSQVETASIKTFMSQDAVWKWVRIASDGSYFVDWYEVGAANSVGRDATNMSASWFVERRHWMLALSMTGDTIQQGSKSDLETAIRSGSRVRCVVKESLSRTLIGTADNLEIYSPTGDIAAQFTRLITFDPHFVPFWRILILSTRGEMKETHWTVGEHVKRGEDVTNVDIDWFVD